MQETFQPFVIQVSRGGKGQD